MAVESNIAAIAGSTRSAISGGQPRISSFSTVSVVLTAKSLGARAIEPLAALPLTGSAELPLVDTNTIEQAHAHGMLVIPWTPNDPATMRALLDRGVDGIITDYPDRLREVLQERGMPLPQQYL
ncbi:glycerophosphodiester phosphodiesterase [Nocardia asiatica]|uniref:glycerophosphodiester phosphodiesterase n=1 Tax=Nocardia asiatica TaxID=209252 RepID=UPI003EE3C430